MREIDLMIENSRLIYGIGVLYKELDKGKDTSGTKEYLKELLQVQNTKNINDIFKIWEV